MVRKASKAMTKHMSSRMKSFSKGTMHSTKTRTGPVVKSRKQAVAIALSEARAKGLKGAGRAPKRK
jgi:hypothetical protein